MVEARRQNIHSTFSVTLSKALNKVSYDYWLL
jgi:hypothetical protein